MKSSCLLRRTASSEVKKIRTRTYQSWSAKIEEADAFIFVTAEYDFNYPAPLRNALEFLYLVWGYKAAGIVSYDGVSGGTRATKSLMGDLTAFKMVPLTEAVNFPFFTKNNITEEGTFTANEVSQKAAQTMLKELVRWTEDLQLIKAYKA